MGSDDAAAAKPQSGRVNAENGDDAFGTKSVIDLIDDIERRSFRRNVTSRPPRARFFRHPTRTLGS